MVANSLFAPFPYPPDSRTILRQADRGGSAATKPGDFMEEAATVPPTATSAEALVPYLRKCGYGDARLATPFRFDKTDVDVVGFAGKPWDNWSACVAAVNHDGDSRASAAKVASLGVTSVFVCGSYGIDWWGLGAKGPTTSKPIKWNQIEGFFREHKAELAPRAIYDAKLLRPSAKRAQLTFFDVGLMPAVEKERGETLLRLVEREIRSLAEQLGRRINSPVAQEEVCRTVFWQLAAKILHDKRVRRFIDIDLADADQVFGRMSEHHGEGDRFPPFGPKGRPAIDAMVASIAGCGSLADVSPEAIADVYENALLDKTVSKARTRRGEKARSVRKELGIHGTPFVLINHMLSQLWPLLDAESLAAPYVFEPACGHAPFLMRAMRWIRQWNDAGEPTTSHDFMRKHLRGVEKEPFARQLSKLALTLADAPHGNSWTIKDGDMFASDVLEKEASKARILLSNPPYEAFSDADRREYKRLGFEVTAQTKAVEMLKRTLPHLPAGGVFGVVMPVGVLHDKESRPVREELLRDFDLSEISVFADNLFENGDHEVAVIMGRKKKPRTKPPALMYRRVREAGMAAFKERLAFSWEREVSPARFAQSEDADLRVPELDEAWAYLSSGPTLDDYATIGNGLIFHGRTRPNARWTIRDATAASGEFGFATVDSDLQICGLPALKKLNLEPAGLQCLRAGGPTGLPQVLLNYAPVARQPWKLKATLDEEGRALTSRFTVTRPRAGGPSALYLWAVLNSPVANAFAYDKLGKRDILVGTMRTMPVPPRSPSHDAAIEHAAARYRALAIAKAAVKPAPTNLFTLSNQATGPVPTHAEVRAALLSMDAAVLRAYDLPPRLERQLLDLFSPDPQNPDGNLRKGVGLDGPDGKSTFHGYYPPGFTAYIPLHELISESLADSTAGRLARDCVPVRSKAADEALALADLLAKGR